MQEYTISLPDEIAERLQRYAEQRRQRPEAIIVEIITRAFSVVAAAGTTPIAGETDD